MKRLRDHVRSPRPARSLRLTAGLAVFVISTGVFRFHPIWPQAEGWPEVTLEEKTFTGVPHDRKAGAVVLLNERKGRLPRGGRGNEAIFQYHWRLKVLTQDGTRSGVVRIPSSGYSQVSNIEARTVRPDGTIVEVASDRITERPTGRLADLEVKEHVIEFPVVEPGAILEYRYERLDRGIGRVHTWSFSDFVNPWFFSDDLFVLHARLSQADLGTTTIQCTPCPESKGTMSGREYVVEFDNLRPYEDEFLRPPRGEVLNNLTMSPFIDWRAVSGFVFSLYEDAIRKMLSVSSIQSLVDGWGQGITDSLEKAKAILHHVQHDFHHVPTSILFGSPSAEQILRTKTATTRDMAILLLAALSRAKIPAFPVLVCGRDYGLFNPKFPSPHQFTHVVAALQDSSGNVHWLDPTITFTPFGFLPAKDSGASALLLPRIADGPMAILDLSQVPARPITLQTSRSAFERSPGSVPALRTVLPGEREPGSTRYSVTVTPGPDRGAEARIIAEYLGEDAVDMRRRLLPVSEQLRTNLLEIFLRSRVRGAAIRSVTVHHLENIEVPLRIEWSLAEMNLTGESRDGIAVPACIVDCLDSSPVQESERTYPFFIDRAWNVEQTVLIRPPAGMAPVGLPAPTRARSAIAGFSAGCEKQDDGLVLCSRVFVARRGTWPVSEDTAVRAMYDAIVNFDRQPVTLRAQTR